jgi:hypothetical protein
MKSPKQLMALLTVPVVLIAAVFLTIGAATFQVIHGTLLLPGTGTNTLAVIGSNGLVTNPPAMTGITVASDGSVTVGGAGLTAYASNLVSGGTVPVATLPTNIVISAGPGVTISTNYSSGVWTFTFAATNATTVYYTSNNVDYISVNTNTFITVINDIVLNGKSYINLTVATNLPGTGFGFKLLTTPNSQGTNWIIDASQATYFKIKLTNNFNLSYLTNASALGASGVACSVRLLPNGADRTITLNSNICLLDTNGWTLLTTMNPGLWQIVLTNAANANGGRNGLLSLFNDDVNYSQTNTLAIFKMSP